MSDGRLQNKSAGERAKRFIGQFAEIKLPNCLISRIFASYSTALLTATPDEKSP